MATRKKKPAPAPAPAPEIPRVVVHEGFGTRSPNYVVGNVYLASKPSFCNSLRLHRIRVTVEVIEEPNEVLAERLRELWETTPYNHHHTDTMRAEARKLGIELNQETRASRAPR